jgi:hypothetical protein
MGFHILKNSIKKISTGFIRKMPCQEIFTRGAQNFVGGLSPLSRSLAPPLAVSVSRVDNDENNDIDKTSNL